MHIAMYMLLVFMSIMMMMMMMVMMYSFLKQKITMDKCMCIDGYVAMCICIYICAYVM